MPAPACAPGAVQGGCASARRVATLQRDLRRRQPATGSISMRFLRLAALLLLGGCIEAADLAQERITAPDYCPTENGIAICED